MTGMKKRAFTIVEMVIVISVIAILAAVLIPTFTGIMKNADISADKQAAAAINVNLASAEEITSAKDIYDAIEATYGTRTISPRSAKHGYNYWYNVETKTIELLTLAEIDEKSRTLTASISEPTLEEGGISFCSEGGARAAAPKTFAQNEAKNARLVFGVFFLLDNNGDSVIGAALNAWETGASAPKEKIDAVGAKANEERDGENYGVAAVLDEIFAKLTTIIYINDTTNYAYDRSTATDTYIAPETTVIPPVNDNVIGGGEGEGEVEAPGASPMPTPSDNTFYLPEGITSVEAGALMFNTDDGGNIIYIQTTFTSADELASVFKIGSTNAIILLLGSETEYYISGNELVGSDGERYPLNYSNTVASFDILLPDGSSSDSYKVAYNASGVITLTAGNYVGKNPGEVSLKGVTWASDSAYVSINENGEMSIIGIPPSESCTAIITATAKGAAVGETVTDTLEVTIVRPSPESTFNIANNIGLDMSIDGAFESIVIDYKDVSSFDFTSVNILCNDGTIKDDEKFVVTPGEGDVFRITKSEDVYTLTLLDPTNSSGKTQQFTVTIGEKGEDKVLTKTFEVSVNDISATPFEVKAPFDGTDFLYRLGNGNAVKLSHFFETTRAADEITLSIATALTYKINGATGSATTTLYDDTWENTTIQFNGTGIATVTLGEVSVKFEIVNGKNVFSYSDFASGTSLVMLQDITISSGAKFTLKNCTLYGNNFTFDVSQGNYTAGGYITSNYVIYLDSGVLDNVKITGKAFDNFSATDDGNDNICNVFSRGNSKILNSYITNCSAPVRLHAGTLEIVNTTLRGGSIANLDIRSGSVILDNVTTINQKSVSGAPASEGSVGFGVIVWYESGSAEITIKNNFTQYNYMTKADFKAIKFDYASTAADEVFKSSNGTAKFIYNDGSKDWINTGIFLMNDGVSSDNIKFAGMTNSADYAGSDVSYNALIATFKGYLFSVKKEKVSLTNPPEYVSLGQGTIYPQISDINIGANATTKTEGSNVYCYYENGTIYVSFDQGGSKTLGSLEGFCTATKLGKPLTLVNIYLDGVKVTESSISFNATGEHTLTFEFADGYNYNASGETFVVYHTKSVKINVNAVKPNAKNAEFTFKDSTATEKVTVGTSTYISAKDVTESDKAWGYITVDGTKIYYPIIDAQFSKSIAGEYTVYFYVFNGAVTITDYADAGTGAAITYNASTTKMPTNLTVENGLSAATYSDISSACVAISKLTAVGSTGAVWDFMNGTYVKDATTYNGYLAHRSNSGLKITEGGGRDKNCITIAQFKYTDEAGMEYRYFVGYYMANQLEASGSGGGSGTCVTPDTLITLADGTKKRVDELDGTEKLLVWNLETGSYDEAYIVFVDNDAESYYNVIHLGFSDGSEVKVIGEHGFFDLDLAKYVYIDENNYTDYIGHSFVKSGDIENNEWSIVTLDSVTVECELTTAWSPVTFEHLCYYTNDVLSMPGGIDGLFNIFEVDTETMTYDKDKMAEDILEYGLYTYEDFAEMIPVEAYLAFNGDWLKVAIEKGILTWEDIAEYAERYIPLM